MSEAINIVHMPGAPTLGRSLPLTPSSRKWSPFPSSLGTIPMWRQERGGHLQEIEGGCGLWVVGIPPWLIWRYKSNAEELKSIYITIQFALSLLLLILQVSAKNPKNLCLKTYLSGFMRWCITVLAYIPSFYLCLAVQRPFSLLPFCWISLEVAKRNPCFWVLISLRLYVFSRNHKLQCCSVFHKVLY